LKTIFDNIQQDIKDDQTWDSYLSGSTAVLGVLCEKTLYTAHVGDSRLVLLSNIEGKLKGQSLTV
jgi:serine/threonine protein phosphatase PrpC